ncbi:olfactory receptor 8S1-like [Acinonyx jubatus]|uniref:Olfactory receptor n=1 Tax=Acinonyx jubatus TaxID=32536 RepID=A0ABM3QDY7_ACIJB|nr:olfactory receptor 8S1-like [Acinonyx jubatus]XP_053082144.1 olfactory receptor 8S1-like [Acinonyx jubatus]
MLTSRAEESYYLLDLKILLPQNSVLPTENSERTLLYMAMKNYSAISEFILLGLSIDPNIQAILFVLFFLIYLFTLMGNFLILLVIRADSHLHMPMYFFLRQLSFLDLCHSSVTVPKMLENLLSESKTIFVESCLAQAFFVFATGGTEACLLAVMAYDRYVAISSPLLYGQVMSNQLCVGMVWGSWGLAFVDALINILLAVNLDYCEDQTLPHFSCELSSLFPLSCSDTSTNFTLLLCSSVLHFFGTFVMIVFSYVRIVSTILSISSTSGRSKAFSTCSSHLTTVILFYGSGFLSYLLPTSGSRLAMMLSLQYSVVTPMLNPLVYSLQNKEVKAAMGRMFRKYFHSLM